MTRIFYDTEFLESDPSETIRLISIGMVREDGAEYYAVSQDATRGRLARGIRRNEWLMANVVPSLPKAPGDARLYQPRRWLFNYADPCVKPRHVIAREVRDFILGVPDPHLWAWYSAYDHVVLCRLWGRMVDLPRGVPMWTNDLKQEAERLGNLPLPSLPGRREHNALDDAREVKFRYEWLAAHGAGTAVRAEPETGLGKVKAAVRKSRGGDAPVQPQGFA